MLVAPGWKYFAFGLRSSFGPRNLNDLRHAKPSQLANLPCGSILVGESSAYELKVFSTRRIRKNRNAPRDAALDQVRRFQRTRALGIGRYSDHICGREWLVDDKRPSCGS